MVRGLPLLKFENDHFSVACGCGKLSKKGHTVVIENSISEPLELLHTNLCGTSDVESLHHKKYILVSFDDFTRFTWVFFLRLKFEMASELIDFIKGIEVLITLPGKRIRSDNGSEFTNGTIEKFLTEKGIDHNFPAPYTPQQNGVVERRNRALVEAPRSMLNFANLPLYLWAEAVSTTCFTQNRSIINRRLNMTPYEALNGRKPGISFLHVF